MPAKAAARIAEPVATLAGLGYAPVAPGTVGSLGALTLAVVLAQYAGGKPGQFAVLAAAAFLPAVWAAGVTACNCGQRDPGKVVIDEAVGQWLTLAGATSLNWHSAVAGFFLFRLFDICKPYPARHAERLPGGWGIVADDVVAGLYGALVLFAAGCFNLY
ncbi:MAG: phosphatidylglycerophosphatase A [Bryobacterales bacterium]|nr:phosphatidylglycerophosphatase A [Bryobacteraceae bacterium]MDW8353859.1 phosphatidylglycerophosphatase A [Bryobacterales bacterium]